MVPRDGRDLLDAAPIAWDVDAAGFDRVLFRHLRDESCDAGATTPPVEVLAGRTADALEAVAARMVPDAPAPPRPAPARDHTRHFDAWWSSLGARQGLRYRVLAEIAGNRGYRARDAAELERVNGLREQALKRRAAPVADALDDVMTRYGPDCDHDEISRELATLMPRLPSPPLRAARRLEACLTWLRDGPKAGGARFLAAAAAVSRISRSRNCCGPRSLLSGSETRTPSSSLGGCSCRSTRRRSIERGSSSSSPFCDGPSGAGISPGASTL